MSAAKPKLLIVEDDISSQQYYAVILSNLYDLTMVSNVKQARQAIRKATYNLAIIDISLPGEENGMDLIKFLAKEHSKSLPAIAISAHAFPQYRQDAIAAGAVDFYTKPILSGKLIDAVEKYLLEDA